jgi:hypothetical protein
VVKDPLDPFQQGNYSSGNQQFKERAPNGCGILDNRFDLEVEGITTQDPQGTNQRGIEPKHFSNVSWTMDQVRPRLAKLLQQFPTGIA